MQKSELETVVNTYCDVCGEKTYNYHTRTLPNYEQRHACFRWNEQEENTCVGILDKQIEEQIK